MAKTNVLYVIWSLGLGGAEQVVINQALGLDRDRFKPTICCLDAPGQFSDMLNGSGVAVHALHKKRGVDLSVPYKIARIISSEDIDIVHTHLWGGNLWGRLGAKLARVKVVTTEHSVDVWKKRHYRLIDRCLAPFTDKIIAVCHRVKDFYVNEVGIDPRRIEVVYNGIDVSGVDDPGPRTTRADLNISNDHPVLVNIGRLIEVKANHVFIESLRLLDRDGLDFKALIIGDGPLKESLRESSQDLIEKGKLQFTGVRRDVKSILTLADASVLSSTREGFSIVVLESMAAAVPFVATDVGGNREQIEDGRSGFIVPVNNPEALATALGTLMRDKALAKEMGRRAREKAVDEFSLERMIKNTEALYERVLADV